MATIESFKADISSMSPSSEPKNQFISCNILKNGPKLNSWCVVLSHQLLRVEQHLLFTFKLAKKGVQKPYSLVWCIVYYKISREICTLWLVRTSSLYFHKARTLRHMSAVLRYNAHSLCHQYKHNTFDKRNKKNCSMSIVELYEHLGIFKITQEKFPLAYITQWCTWCIFIFLTVFIHPQDNI